MSQLEMRSLEKTKQYEKIKQKNNQSEDRGQVAAYKPLSQSINRVRETWLKNHLNNEATKLQQKTEKEDWYSTSDFIRLISKNDKNTNNRLERWNIKIEKLEFFHDRNAARFELKSFGNSMSIDIDYDNGWPVRLKIRWLEGINFDTTAECFKVANSINSMLYRGQNLQRWDNQNPFYADKDWIIFDEKNNPFDVNMLSSKNYPQYHNVIVKYLNRVLPPYRVETKK